MLASTLIALAGAALAFASPDGKGGVDIVKDADFKKAEKAAKISLKEICYRNLYADVSKFKVKYNKEVLVHDEKGKDVFLFDGIKKDSNDREFYFEEFCYKQFNLKQHDANVAKENTAVIDNSGKNGYGGGKGVYKRGFNDNIGLFDRNDFLGGWGGYDDFGGKGLGGGCGGYNDFGGKGGYGGYDDFGGKGGYGGYNDFGGKGGYGGYYGGGYGKGGFDNYGKGGFDNYGKGGFDNYGKGDFGGYGGYGKGGFENGYPGRDGFDGKGYWTRRLVKARA